MTDKFIESEKTVCYQEYVYLKHRADKLERKLEVIKAAGCGMAAPLQEKLAALEKLYGQYSVHSHEVDFPAMLKQNRKDA